MAASRSHQRFDAPVGLNERQFICTVPVLAAHVAHHAQQLKSALTVLLRRPER